MSASPAAPTAANLTPDWSTFLSHYHEYPQVGFSLDLSSSGVDVAALEALAGRMSGALKAMAELEKGAIANPDEKRMVGHYWLRAPELAPSPELADRIEQTIDRIEQFAADIHSGRITTPEGQLFDTVISIGIGGSALGPQLVEKALAHSRQPMEVFFLDNTDPDGIDSLLDALGPDTLATTLVLVTSKSGGTPETLNGMLEVESLFHAMGRHFGRQAVAITGDGSKLYQTAEEGEWLEIFPMEDWVGGRTSVTSAVGLLPAALGGVDIREFLRGARDMDALTRSPDPHTNPAALLAAAWYQIGEGKGRKDMVVLPYKDRLDLFSRYLQQLVMESLGKALDRDGQRVEAGIAVYGNKGSTDQHAYVQQLRDGLRNFFVTFIAVDKARRGSSIDIEEGVRTEDFLNAFFLGTRSALAEEGRPSLTLTMADVSAYHLSALIALFERAVGLYAELININAYHQPGVEAGKKAATGSLELQRSILRQLNKAPGPMSVPELAAALRAEDRQPLIFYLCRHLAQSGRIKRVGSGPTCSFRGLKAH
jgi:glucose-6-phosphate isomerase